MSRWRHHPSLTASGAVPALVAVAVLALSGCTDSSSGSSTPSPEDSAAVVAEAFRLPDSTRSCLVDGFSQRSEARAAMAPGVEPSGTQQEQLGDVVQACVSDADFATALATVMTASLPPTDPTRAEEQTACLRDAVVALDDDERRTLQVGLLTLGGALDSDLALARGDLVNRLTATCDVPPPS
jgi:hypothetical protein